MHKRLTLLFIISLFFIAAKAQTNAQTEQFIYIQCSDIDFEKYRQLDAAVKADNHFIISTACIPAHILQVRINTTTQQIDASAEFGRFRNLCSGAGIQTAELLGSFTQQMFIDQCKNARTGN